MGDPLYDDLLVELECPICTNYMSPPIRQCATGHNVCDSCHKKLQKCALCQGKFSEARNLALEALAVKMRYPCINRDAGCTARLSYMEKEMHELRCNMRGFKCPMERCDWVGKLEEIVAHWNSKKMTSKPYGKSNICHTKIKNESYYVNIVNAFDKLFWFKCKLTKNRLFWSVQYLGKAQEAENYYFEIEIFKPGRSRQKIVISDYCQSIELENSTLFKTGTCISIDSDSVNDFVSNDQLLIYYLRVGKSDNVTQKQPTENKVKERNTKPRDRSKGPNTYKKPPQPRRPQNPNEGFVLL